MMNHDQIFEQRWEFRRREADGDTSSDNNRSNSCGDPANRNRKFVTDLVLSENDDEASDGPGCQGHEDKLCIYNSIQSQIVEAEERKVESSKKKKKAVPKKSGVRAVNENKKRKLEANEVVMLKDLKVFADSLIHDLAAARENMFVHMREEMRELVASRSNLKPAKKNVRRSWKKKVYPKNGTETGMKPQNCGSTREDAERNVARLPKAVAEAAKHDQVLELNEPHKGDRRRLSEMVHMNLAYSAHQVVSSSNQRNHVHFNDLIPSGMPTNHSHQIAKIQPEEQFGSSSHSRLKGIGLLGRNSSQMFIRGIGFPVPLIQGTDNGLNMPSLTCCEKSLMTKNGSIARFPGRSWVPSEQAIPVSMTSKVPRKSDGEFLAARSQDLKDCQFYLTSKFESEL